MSVKKFKSGDKVQLLSGGPEMTTLYYDVADQVVCTWWNETKKKFDERTFPQDALQKIAPQ